jgi:hypothetical protein
VQLKPSFSSSPQKTHVLFMPWAKLRTTWYGLVGYRTSCRRGPG